MAMPKSKSIGISSESTVIQHPKPCTFVTFIITIISMTPKLAFVTSGSLH